MGKFSWYMQLLRFLGRKKWLISILSVSGFWKKNSIFTKDVCKNIYSFVMLSLYEIDIVIEKSSQSVISMNVIEILYYTLKIILKYWSKATNFYSQFVVKSKIKITICQENRW